MRATVPHLATAPISTGSIRLPLDSVVLCDITPSDAQRQPSPPRYHGDAGEVNAAFRPAHQVPELSTPSGNATHYLVTGASSEGKFGLYRWDMGPAPSGPDPHFHRTISESFFVLS